MNMYFLPVLLCRQFPPLHAERYVFHLLIECMYLILLGRVGFPLTTLMWVGLGWVHYLVGRVREKIT